MTPTVRLDGRFNIAVGIIMEHGARVAVVTTIRLSIISRTKLAVVNYRFRLSGGILREVLLVHGPFLEGELYTCLMPRFDFALVPPFLRLRAG